MEVPSGRKEFFIMMYVFLYLAFPRCLMKSLFRKEYSRLENGSKWGREEHNLKMCPASGHNYLLLAVNRH